MPTDPIISSGAAATILLAAAVSDFYVSDPWRNWHTTATVIDHMAVYGEEVYSYAGFFIYPYHPFASHIYIYKYTYI